MVEVSSAGDNDAQHLADNKCKGSDTACIKCEELENKLQETLLELSSAKLIIKSLEKEIDTITAPAHTTRPNTGSGFYGNMKYLMVTTGFQSHLAILTYWDTLQNTLHNMKNSPPDTLELLRY